MHAHSNQILRIITRQGVACVVRQTSVTCTQHTFAHWPLQPPMPLDKWQINGIDIWRRHGAQTVSNDDCVRHIDWDTWSINSYCIMKNRKTSITKIALLESRSARWFPRSCSQEISSSIVQTHMESASETARPINSYLTQRHILLPLNTRVCWGNRVCYRSHLRGHIRVPYY